MGKVNSSLLAGKRVVITRAAEQSAELIQELISRGAVPVLRPLLSFAAPEDAAPLDAMIEELAGFDWAIFTSVNAVRAVAVRARTLGHCQLKSASVQNVATVGPATTEAAKEDGFRVTHIAATHNGVALAHELGEQVRNKRVFLPRSDRANPDLPAVLRQYGARVTEVVAYRNVPPNEAEQRNWIEILSGGADAILFFSPTAVIHLVEQLDGGDLRIALDGLAVIAIGPVTANALREMMVERINVAADTTPAAAVQALEEYFAGREKQISVRVKQG